MIFVDSNIPMYIVGASREYASRARDAVDRLADRRERLVTDAEAFQEVLHRYHAIDRRDAIPLAFEAFLAIVDEVLTVGIDDLVRARDVLLAHWDLSARDALHVAVMRRHGIQEVLSFDTDFDKVPGIARVG